MDNTPSRVLHGAWKINPAGWEQSTLFRSVKAIREGLIIINQTPVSPGVSKDETNGILEIHCSIVSTTANRTDAQSTKENERSISLRAKRKSMRLPFIISRSESRYHIHGGRLCRRRRKSKAKSGKCTRFPINLSAILMSHQSAPYRHFRGISAISHIAAFPICILLTQQLCKV